MYRFLAFFLGAVIIFLFLFNTSQTVYAHDEAGCNAGNEGSFCLRQGENFCCGADYCNYQWRGQCYWWWDDHYHCSADEIIPPRLNHASCVEECRVCSPGETQTERTESLSCTSNPSQCGGYTGRCDQYTTVRERSRTCNSDCGGWSSWSNWYIVDEYPQCPTDSRINCGTCTAPPTCGDGSCNNGETCSTCSQDCGSCPPNARYRCSGSSCIRDDAGGTTTNPSCGGLCSAPPPGCPNATVSVSPNPVNTNSPVTFSATSSFPYANANISHGGGAQGGDDFSITGTYTWRWVYDPPGRWGNSSSTAGNYNATFSGNRPGGGSSCTFSTSYTVQNTTPANLTVTGVPSCSVAPYNVTFSWQNTSSTLWLDVSENSGFNGFANKNVSNQTSVDSSGFNLLPNRTYYWRLWNGSTHTPGPSFFTPFCPSNLTVNKPACSDTPYNVTFNWQNTNPTLWLDITRAGSGWATYSNKDVGNQTQTIAPSGFNPLFTFNPTADYLWRLWNGADHFYGLQWSVPLCQQPWVQTIGGDVHSNVSIDLGGN